jgi:putative transposase
MLDRMCEQREVVPSAGIVDSQSVQALGARKRGYDAHKRLAGASGISQLIWMGDY